MVAQDEAISYRSYYLIGSQTSMAMISWVPVAFWPKAAAILYNESQLRAEKRPEIRSSSTTDINKREK